MPFRDLSVTSIFNYAKVLIFLRIAKSMWQKVFGFYIF